MMKLAAIAVVASLALVACKNNKVEEPIDTVDTTAIEQVVDEICDSVVDTVDLAVAEEPAAPAVKKTAKKAAQPAEAGVKAADNTSKAVASNATDNNIKEGEATKVDNVKRTGRR